MPLSDREQQILQEIERHLYEQDPKFAHGVAAKTLKSASARNFRRGILLFLAGLTALVAFFATTQVWWGVVAFLLMLGGATMAYHHGRKLGAEPLRALRSGTPLAKLFGNLEGRMRNLRRKDES
jgi:VIT1/CCC1 family predicted Fe2+/Mn2+ transporter